MRKATKCQENAVQIFGTICNTNEDLDMTKKKKCLDKRTLSSHILLSRSGEKLKISLKKRNEFSEAKDGKAIDKLEFG